MSNGPNLRDEAPPIAGNIAKVPTPPPPQWSRGPNRRSGARLVTFRERRPSRVLMTRSSYQIAQNVRLILRFSKGQRQRIAHG